MSVTMVVVGEDCALPDTGKYGVGRRGLCGVVLVHKVCLMFISRSAIYM